MSFWKGCWHHKWKGDGNRQLFNNWMKSKTQEKQWSEQQKQLLSELFPQYTTKKWKMISIKMKQAGFNRTLIECRQKWSNFLDPSLKSDEWNSEELRRMFDLYEEHGTRWSYIQKHISRSQRNIKNKFYETVRNYIRFIGTILCDRQTSINSQIKRLPPSFLQKLYTSDDNQYDYLRGEIKKMVYRMNFRIDKTKLFQRIRQKQSLYRKFIMHISKKEFKNPESIQYVTEIGEEMVCRRGKNKMEKSMSRSEGDCEGEDYQERGSSRNTQVRVVKMEDESLQKEKISQSAHRSNQEIKQEIQERILPVTQNQGIKQQEIYESAVADQVVTEQEKEAARLAAEAARREDEQYYPFMANYPQMYYMNQEPQVNDQYNLYYAYSMYPKIQNADMKTKAQYFDY